MAFILDGNVAEPTDLETLGEFQGLQRMLRAAGADIDIDGRIGPGTRAHALAVIIDIDNTEIRRQLTPLAITPDFLAANARTFTTVLGRAIGVSPNFRADPQSAPDVDVPEVIPLEEEGRSFLPGLAVVGVLVGVLWFLGRE